MGLLYELEKNRRKLMEALEKDTGIFILCIILALITWTIVTVNEDGVSTVDISLTYRENTPHLVIARGTQQQCRVTVKGPLYLLKAFNQDPPTIEMTLPATRPGTTVYKLSQDDFPFLRNMTVQAIEPAEIRIVLAKKMRKMIDVIPDIRGAVHEDFEIEKLDVIPSRISVEGPETEIRNITELKTNAITVDGTRSRFETELQLSLPDEFIKPDKNTVKLIVSVREKTVNHSLTIPINNHDWNVLPASAVSVSVSGPISLIKKLDADDFSAELNQAEIDSGRLTVGVMISKYPDQITVVKVTPDKVRIKKK